MYVQLRQPPWFLNLIRIFSLLLDIRILNQLRCNCLDIAKRCVLLFSVHFFWFWGCLFSTVSPLRCSLFLHPTLCNGAIHCSGSFVCQIAGDRWPINSNNSLAVHLYRNSNQPCNVYCPSALTRWIVVPCLSSVRNHCLQSWYLPFNCINN